MKYYQILATKPVFTFREAVDIIGKKERASKVLNAMVEEGSVHRIKQNLYTCADFGTGDDYASKFQIASKINSDSFLSFHSAFEYYGFYNQVYLKVQVCSTKRFADFSYGDNDYQWLSTKSFQQIRNLQGVKVVTIERAIVDSIDRIGKVMDVEELDKCLDLVPRVDEKKILEMLSVYHQERLYRKVGYILSFYQDELSISNDFFRICKENGVLSNKGYLVGKKKDNLVFNAKWGLYVYEDFKNLSFKGGDIDV